MKIPLSSFWRRPRSTQPVKVIGKIEGYIVARYANCTPFLRTEKEFGQEFIECSPAQTFRAATLIAREQEGK